MAESNIQSSFKKLVKKAGGMTLKITTPSQRGTPDLLCILFGTVFMVEVKTPTGDLSPSQKIMIKKLRSHGMCVEVFDSHKQMELKIKQVLAKKYSFDAIR